MDEKSRFLLIFAMILIPVLSVLIVHIPLTVAPPSTTLSNRVVEMLLELRSNIESLPNEAFVEPNRAAKYRATLLSIVEMAIKQIQAGALQGAIGKLNDLTDKIGKWVVEPWKTTLIEEVAEIISLLGFYV
jgi:hypothetical protein